MQEQLSFTLKQLALEELLSEEQHLELAKELLIDEFYSSPVAEDIENTKVGHGLIFLPRKLIDLMKDLQVLLEELAETGTTEVRKKVAAVLEGLRRRNEIKEDNNMSK